jgi:hypothetical protein
MKALPLPELRRTLGWKRTRRNRVKATPAMTNRDG